MKIKAVIFDIDGTILDSEKIYLKFWISSFKHFGYKMTKEQYYQLRSMGSSYILKKLKKWYGKDLDYEPMKAYRFKHRDAYIYKHGLEVKPGIKEALMWLKKHKVKTAIATGGSLLKATENLKRAGLLKYFDKLICASDVKRGKPAPDIYIYACKQLGINPKQCMAIEDCPNGVISAYKAKINTVMIPDLDQPSKQLLKLNIKVVKDGFELIELFKTTIC